jgi:TolB protein
VNPLPARLAGIGPNGELFLLSVGAGAAPSIVLDPQRSGDSSHAPPPRAVFWPTWMPDGSAVAASIESGEAGRPDLRVLRMPTDGAEPTPLFQNPPGSSAVGPGAPHYLNPSPDGRHLAILAQFDSSGLVLLFTDAQGRGPAQPLTRGAPLFTAWSPDSGALLLHVGGELLLLELETAPSMQVLASDHVGYRVPAWSPDGGRFAVIAREGRSHALRLFERGGRSVGSLSAAPATGVFAWSPDGSLIALAELGRGAQPLLTRLRLVSVLGGAATAIPNVDCLAFVWSPAGAYLAVLMPGAGDGRCAWWLIDAGGEVVRRFPPFRPAAEFSLYVSFFDQYARSHALWSPDGASLLAFGRVANNGTPPELLPAAIYACDVPSGGVQMLAEGSVAFWAPTTG